jgi:transcriptional regulator with GAF, ATPase, and Fis domain
MAMKSQALQELQSHPDFTGRKSEPEMRERKWETHGKPGFHGAHIPTLDEKSSLKLLVRNAKGEAERGAIAQALEETHWNRKAAARLLNVSYRALLYKIQEYHLAPPSEAARFFRTEDLRPAK